MVLLTLSRAGCRGQAVARRRRQFGEGKRSLLAQSSCWGGRQGCLRNFADPEDLGGSVNGVTLGACQ